MQRNVPKDFRFSLLRYGERREDTQETARHGGFTVGVEESIHDGRKKEGDVDQNRRRCFCCEDKSKNK
jgi:hypothetical protein